jgi:hypothetical protein
MSNTKIRGKERKEQQRRRLRYGLSRVGVRSGLPGLWNWAIDSCGTCGLGLPGSDHGLRIASPPSYGA